nr:odorant binding protein 26 [Graphosoma rubrolineatum]
MVQAYLFLAVLITAVEMGQSTFSQQTLDTCRSRTGYGGNYYYITDDISREGRCFLACLLETEGMMRNGVIDRDATINFINQWSYGSEVMKQRFIRIVNECLSQVAPNPDSCEYAFQYMRCKVSRSWST